MSLFPVCKFVAILMIAGMLSSLAARADDFHIRGSAIVRGGKPVVYDLAGDHHRPRVCWRS